VPGVHALDNWNTRPFQGLHPAGGGFLAGKKHLVALYVRYLTKFEYRLLVNYFCGFFL
jgi:hypothetical protein